jgi:cyclase
MQIHAHSHPHYSRRDFFRVLTGSTLAGASLLELAWHRAAWARAQVDAADTKLFDIEKVSEGVYFARARAQAEINANAAIFVNSADVLVVDAHSKPSAAASLIGQIAREVTPKPVRYVVNSHFHWDHVQGNHAYRANESKIDFIASEQTKQLMSDLAEKRLQESLDAAPAAIDGLRARAAKSTNPAEKAFCEDQIRQIQAYQREMANFSLELPTITFATSKVIPDKAHDLHIEFHGRAHTAGDVVVFCPQARAVATGDMIHGFLPTISDGYPKVWPKTIDDVGKLQFNRILPGHGPLHRNRALMTGMRNYIEELTARVEEGKKAGKGLQELQKSIPMSSLKSLQSNGYGESVIANQTKGFPNFGPPAPLQDGINTNIAEIWKNLERV